MTPERKQLLAAMTYLAKRCPKEFRIARSEYGAYFEQRRYGFDGFGLSEYWAIVMVIYPSTKG